MKRPTGSFIHPKSGYTLVEILTATVLTLVMMSGVVTIFGRVSQAISNSRSSLEMMDRLRAAQRTLQRDLGQVTVTMLPPRRPESAEGYFEYVEGPVGPVTATTTFAQNDELSDDDSTVGDFDDIVIFTAHSGEVPFVGRYGTGSIESQNAEIAWFVRGRTLYRRVLLIAPQVLSDLDTDNDGDIDSDDFGVGKSFFNLYDISSRPAAFGDNGNGDGDETSWAPNSLADLTKRENRFAHQRYAPNDVFPFSVSRWGQLGLPLLQECSHPGWMDWDNSVIDPPPSVTAVTSADFWTNPYPWAGVEPLTGTLSNYQGPRVGEDVILTNVIGFDVKVWDPDAPVIQVEDNQGTTTDELDDVVLAVVVPGDAGYPTAVANRDTTVGNRDYPVITTGAYVDLNYAAGAVNTSFDGNGDLRSGLSVAGGPYVYDTWSFHYEHDGVDQDGDGIDDQGTNGFDDALSDVDYDGDGTIDRFAQPANGIVDDVDELETSPPYPVALRGIQVKIRVFEPDSRQVREVTVVQDFLTK